MTNVGCAVVMPAAEQRANVRRVVNLSGFAREADLKLLEIRVRDLSGEGCHILGDVDFEKGARLWIKVPGIAPRAATIAWTATGEAGCCFETPISAESLEDVAKARFRSPRELRRVFGKD